MSTITTQVEAGPNQWVENGVPRTTPLKIENPGMGVAAEYVTVIKDDGTPSHSQIRITEAGGPVIVPVYQKNGEDQIGVLEDEDRPLDGRRFVEVPRGFKIADNSLLNGAPQSTPQDVLASPREANVTVEKNRFKLIKSGINANTAWLGYTRPEAVEVYRLDVRDDEIYTNPETGRMTFAPGVTNDKKLSKVVFLPIDKVIDQSSCSLSLMATMLATRK